MNNTPETNMNNTPENQPKDQRPALSEATGSAPSSFLKEDDIRLAKEWAENLCIPWRTGDGWRSVACRLAHEVERLNAIEQKRLDDDKAWDDVIATEEYLNGD